MGQAKQRGSFEQRQASAVARIEAEAVAEKALRAELRRKELEAEMALPLDLRARRREARFQSLAKTAMLAGMAASMSMTAQEGKSHDN